jgi:hypothetical protein
MLRLIVLSLCFALVSCAASPAARTALAPDAAVQTAPSRGETGASTADVTEQPADAARHAPARSRTKTIALAVLWTALVVVVLAIGLAMSEGSSY